MGLFLVALLVAVASVRQSSATAVETAGRESGHGGLLVQTPLVQSYIRYIDENGVAQLVGYNYPQPLHALTTQQHSYLVGGIGRQPQHFETRAYSEGQLPKLTEKEKQEEQFLLLDPSALSKEREQHFRAWCEQRYQALKAEVEKLRASGRQPSADILAQMQPIEQILSGTSSQLLQTGQTAAGVLRAREEHQRIWDDAHLKILQSPVELRSISGSGLWQVTPIQGIQQPAQHVPIIKTAPFTTQTIYAGAVPKSATLAAAAAAHRVQLSPTGVVLETPEVMRARAEHLRLYNEVKERIAKAPGHQREVADQLKEATASLAKQRVVVDGTSGISGLEVGAVRSLNIQEGVPLSAQILSTQDQAAGYKHAVAGAAEGAAQIAFRSSAGFDAPQPFQPKPVEETVEVKRAREEHLKLKAQLDSRAIAALQQQQQQEQQQQQQEQRQQLVALHETARASIAAQEQHSGIAGELKNGAVQQLLRTDQELKSPLQALGVSTSSTVSEYLAAKQPAQVQETAEVQRAREEHLKLVADATKSVALASEGDNILGFTDRLASIGEQIHETAELQQQERLLEAERLREAARLRQEEQRREEQRIRDLERSREEEKRMTAEQFRLRQEEEERLKSEKLAAQEEESVRRENLLKDIKFTAQTQSENAQRSSVLPLSQSIVPAYVLSAQHATNPFLVRYINQPAGSATSYTLTEHQQQTLPLAKGGYYYLPPGAGVGLGVGVDAKTKAVAADVGKAVVGAVVADSGAGFAVGGALQSLAVPQLQGPLLLHHHHPLQEVHSTLLKESTVGSSQIQPLIGVFSQSQSNALSDLEQAKREHFRAHEIALEQLRLAHLKNPLQKVHN